MFKKTGMARRKGFQLLFVDVVWLKRLFAY